MPKMSETVASNLSIIWPRLGIRRMALLLLGVGLGAAFLLSISLGSVKIPLNEIVTILLGGEPSKSTWATIIFQFRLPKALTAVLAGAALSVSGLQMQTLFRNPLAGPFVLGINSGASLGVALVVLSVGSVGGTALLAGLGVLGEFSLVVAAGAGSALVLFLVTAVARRVATMTLLILGLMFGYATGAFVTLLLYFSSAERIQAYIAWTFGSFGGVTWTQMKVLAPTILIGLLISWMFVKPLNALLLGELYARTVGITVKQTRFWIIISTALLAGSVTAFTGPIAFIGVAVPHLCRSLFNSSDHRILVPASLMLGGIIALIADIIAQLPGSQTVLPLNAVTALIGAPVVTWVILRRKNLRASFAQ